MAKQLSIKLIAFNKFLVGDGKQYGFYGKLNAATYAVAEHHCYPKCIHLICINNDFSFDKQIIEY